MEKKKMNFFRRMMGIRKQGCCPIKIEEIDTKNNSDDTTKTSEQSPSQGCSCGCCCEEKQR